MKFLIIWEKHFHYTDSICHALKENNQEAVSFSFRRFNKKIDIPLWGYIKCRLRLSKKECYKKNYYHRERERLLEYIDHQDIDAIIILNGNFRYIIDDQFFVRIKSNNVSCVLWFLDAVPDDSGKVDPEKIVDRNYLMNYDKIYVFEPKDIEKLNAKYGIEAKHIYIGAADEIYNLQYSNTEKVYDICFVGAADKKRLEILNTVAEYCKGNKLKLNIQGLCAYDKTIKASTKGRLRRLYPYLTPFIAPGRVDPVDLAELYKKTKINLNIVTERHASINPRTFEILASGGFQMVDYNEEYDKVFINKENIVIYKNQIELIELMDYYLKNDVERNKIAKNGYDIVKQNFLLKDIVKEIIKDLS